MRHQNPPAALLALNLPPQQLADALRALSSLKRKPPGEYVKARLGPDDSSERYFHLEQAGLATVEYSFPVGHIRVAATDEGRHV